MNRFVALAAAVIFAITAGAANAAWQYDKHRHPGKDEKKSASAASPAPMTWASHPSGTSREKEPKRRSTMKPFDPGFGAPTR